jgi:hypothetical protein
MELKVTVLSAHAPRSAFAERVPATVARFTYTLNIARPISGDVVDGICGLDINWDNMLLRSNWTIAVLVPPTLSTVAVPKFAVGLAEFT